jgi:hypothetical protein
MMQSMQIARWRFMGHPDIGTVLKGNYISSAFVCRDPFWCEWSRGSYG